MYKGNRRKEVCRLFGRQKHMHIGSKAPHLPPCFEFTFTLPPKNEKPLTTKKLPLYCFTAEKIPPYFGLPLPPKSLPPKNEKNAYRQKNTAVLHYRRKNTAIFWFYRFRQKGTATSRYRQKVPPTLNTARSCLLYTSPSPRDGLLSRMPSSA